MEPLALPALWYPKSELTDTLPAATMTDASVLSHVVQATPG